MGMTEILATLANSLYLPLYGYPHHNILPPGVNVHNRWRADSSELLQCDARHVYI